MRRLALIMLLLVVSACGTARGVSTGLGDVFHGVGDDFQSLGGAFGG